MDCHELRPRNDEGPSAERNSLSWIPACAGMTALGRVDLSVVWSLNQVQGDIDVGVRVDCHALWARNDGDVGFTSPTPFRPPCSQGGEYRDFMFSWIPSQAGNDTDELTG